MFHTPSKSTMPDISLLRPSASRSLSPAALASCCRCCCCCNCERLWNFRKRSSNNAGEIGHRENSFPGSEWERDPPRIRNLYIYSRIFRASVHTYVRTESNQTFPINGFDFFYFLENQREAKILNDLHSELLMNIYILWGIFQFLLEKKLEISFIKHEFYQLFDNLFHWYLCGYKLELKFLIWKWTTSFIFKHFLIN